MKPHRGTLILVLGILGLVVCAPFGHRGLGHGIPVTSTNRRRHHRPKAGAQRDPGWQNLRYHRDDSADYWSHCLRHPVLDWFCRRPGATSAVLEAVRRAISRERCRARLPPVETRRDIPRVARMPCLDDTLLHGEGGWSLKQQKMAGFRQSVWLLPFINWILK